MNCSYVKSLRRIASTHHENTELDHCFSPVAMGDCVIDLTKSPNGRVADAFFPPPPAAPRAGAVRAHAFLCVRARCASHINRVVFFVMLCHLQISARAFSRTARSRS